MSNKNLSQLVEIEKDFQVAVVDWFRSHEDPLQLSDKEIQKEKDRILEEIEARYINQIGE